MFRIGDFSRLARVTIRTLHHYDEAGVLQPAHVDPDTGYRYYSAAQLRPLQRILLLRDLGFSIEEIRELTSPTLQSADLARRLDERRAQIASSIAQDQSRLSRLDALRDSVDAHAPAEIAPITLRETAAIAVHCVRERVSALGAPVQALFEHAESQVAQAKLRADASPMLLFHDGEYRESELDIEVCIPVIRQEDALRTRVVPASLVACVTYEGSYQQTPCLYESLLRWLERSELAVSGPLREVYHRFGADQVGYKLRPHVIAKQSRDFVTELQVPVFTAAQTSRRSRGDA